MKGKKSSKNPGKYVPQRNKQFEEILRITLCTWSWQNIASTDERKAAIIAEHFKIVLAPDTAEPNNKIYPPHPNKFCCKNACRESHNTKLLHQGLLLDMSKAFDTVNRNILFKALEIILLPEELNLLSILTNNPKLKVRVRKRMQWRIYYHHRNHERGLSISSTFYLLPGTSTGRKKQNWSWALIRADETPARNIIAIIETEQSYAEIDNRWHCFLDRTKVYRQHHMHM